jgi:cyclohexyl-isocyanide hydratase
MTDTPLQIGFVLFPDLTQLDLTGPWEVLTRIPGARCHLLARDLAPVASSSGGLAIVPTLTFGAAPQLDVLCVPGGPGHLIAMEDAELLGFLRRQAPGCRFVTAVCTGSLVLAAAGLLRGRRATSHWMSLERLARFGAEPVKARVVEAGPFVTGGGVTAGIDFGLTLAERLAGRATAEGIQLSIEYDPKPPFAGSPDAAAPPIVDAAQKRAEPYRARMAEIDARAAERLKPSRTGETDATASTR